MSEKFHVMLHEDMQGWAIYTGCEGEDPRLVAWFKDKETADQFMKDNSNLGEDHYFLDPDLTRAHIDMASWNDYQAPGEEDKILSEMLKTGKSPWATDGCDPVLRLQKTIDSTS